MTTEVSTDPRIPDDIAREAVSPTSYRDEDAHSYPALAWLRRNNPFGVAHVEGYDPLWLATKYADIREIELNPEVFASGLDEPGVNDRASSDFLKLMRGDNRTLDTLAYMDAPEHTAIRSVAQNWFQHRTAGTREERIRGLARQAVETLLSTGGECDFVRDFSMRYPLRVIMQLLGVPEEDEALMLKLTQEMFGTTDPEEQREEVAHEPDVAARMWRASIAGFYEYCDKLAAERRADPRDDLISLVANAKVNGEYLSDSYVRGYFVVVAAAGHDTTSSTIAGAMYAFAKFPGLLDQVREDPSLIPGTIEEALRWVSPVKHFQRVLTRDFEFRGRNLKQGDHVMLMYASANRDEDVFTNPEVFDVTRQPNRHLAFGHGAHSCLGAHVARLEMRILLEELLPKLRSVELAGPPAFVASNFITGLKRLPIRFQTT
jgi:cytochrome P450